VMTQALPALTALRGIAAVTVLVFHLVYGFRGYLAVDLFFLLSGFVLMYAHGQMAVTPHACLRFLRARFARIYPLYLFTLLLMLPLLDSSRLFSRNGLIISLLLLQSPWYSMCWNFGSWSISAEWHAYLLFPFLAANYRSRSTPVLLITLAACAAIVSGVADFIGSGNITNSPLVFLRCLPEFISGMILCCLYARGLPRWIGRDRTTVAVVVLLVLAEALHAADGVMVCLLAGLLLACAANRGRAARLLNCRLLSYIGRISYSLYITGQFAFMAVDWLLPAPTVTHKLLVAGLSFAIAAAVSPTIEYPARNWVRNLTFARMTGRAREDAAGAASSG
jgi:peptidoglycan/LPS O-acetylase OafA/YrhL